MSDYVPPGERTRQKVQADQVARSDAMRKRTEIVVQIRRLAATVVPDSHLEIIERPNRKNRRSQTIRVEGYGKDTVFALLEVAQAHLLRRVLEEVDPKEGTVSILSAFLTTDGRIYPAYSGGSGEGPGANIYTVPSQNLRDLSSMQVDDLSRISSALSRKA